MGTVSECFAVTSSFRLLIRIATHPPLVITQTQQLSIQLVLVLLHIILFDIHLNKERGWFPGKMEETYYSFFHVHKRCEPCISPSNGFVCQRIIWINELIHWTVIRQFKPLDEPPSFKAIGVTRDPFAGKWLMTT